MPYVYTILRVITIKRDPLHIEEIRDYFSEENVLHVHDLYDFYIGQDPLLNDNALRARVHRLVKMGVLSRVGRGQYILGHENIYIPQTSPKTRQLYNFIKKSYPLLDICIWHTGCLNNFMIHQPARFNLIVEVERYAEESVFYHLKEEFKNVYLNPSEEVYFNYIVEKRDSIIIKTLISEAPVQDPYKLSIPTLEKILVDIFCDKLIFSPQQGEEMDNIWRNALDTYTINQSTLLRYADRRGRKREIGNYLNQISDHW